MGEAPADRRAGRRADGVMGRSCAGEPCSALPGAGLPEELPPAASERQVGGESALAGARSRRRALRTTRDEGPSTHREDIQLVRAALGRLKRGKGHNAVLLVEAETEQALDRPLSLERRAAEDAHGSAFVTHTQLGPASGGQRFHLGLAVIFLFKFFFV